MFNRYLLGACVLNLLRISIQFHKKRFVFDNFNVKTVS